ncbi:BQ5605_C033g11237 [Microbotryum silenes-dioicae]|uniref:BQ5605_C033g11237 protein n=1 Tax=Microbotryum silenes-dioicae TaxID=796604 RepID=A0A2X0MH58_9BASI|nr:BQ5605_C033g11237 [Microbotryum silenes-dioicae]
MPRTRATKAPGDHKSSDKHSSDRWLEAARGEQWCVAERRRRKREQVLESVLYGPPFGQQMDLRARGYLRVTIRFALMRAQPTQSTRFLGFFHK